MKNFKPRIKARIRKNKQILKKEIKNFFIWIKGAELVSLKECNTSEDPVRPELNNEFRTRLRRSISVTSQLLGSLIIGFGAVLELLDIFNV